MLFEKMRHGAGGEGPGAREQGIARHQCRNWLGETLGPSLLPTLGCVKDIYFVIYGIISESTDKGQFHYLSNLKGPQVGNYLYTTQFLLLR